MNYLTAIEEKNYIHPSYFILLLLIFSISINYIIILSVAQTKTLKLFLIPYFFLHPHIQYNSKPYGFYLESGLGSLFPLLPSLSQQLFPFASIASIGHLNGSLPLFCLPYHQSPMLTQQLD